MLFRSITMLRKICNHPDLVCDPDEASLQSFVSGNVEAHPKADSDGSDNGDGKYDDDDNDEIGTELDESTSDFEGSSLVDRAGKFQVLAKILPLWRKQGHRVLIFCQWRKMLNIIERFTRAQGWRFLRLDGNTAVGSRQRMVDEFNNNDDYFGMLMTTKTGGVGLVSYCPVRPCAFLTVKLFRPN